MRRGGNVIDGKSKDAKGFLTFEQWIDACLLLRRWLVTSLYSGNSKLALTTFNTTFNNHLKTTGRDM